MWPTTGNNHCLKHIPLVMKISSRLQEHHPHQKMEHPSKKPQKRPARRPKPRPSRTQYVQTSFQEGVSYSDHPSSTPHQKEGHRSRKPQKGPSAKRPKLGPSREALFQQVASDSDEHLPSGVPSSIPHQKKGPSTSRQLSLQPKRQLTWSLSESEDKNEKDEDVVIRKFPISRIVKERTSKSMGQQFKKKALDMKAIKSYIMRLDEDSLLCALYSGRVTVTCRDVQLAGRIRGIFGTDALIPFLVHLLGFIA